MKKEKLPMRAVYEELNNIGCSEIDDDNEILYEEIQKEFIDVNISKCVVYWEIVFKRIIDNKYFKVGYGYTREGGNNIYEQIAEEVFPYQSLTTYYK